MSLAVKLAAASPADDPHLLARLADQALDEGEEEQVLPLLRRVLERRPDARLWQWLGLLERALDRHEEALASFAQAARLAPSDASIAHGRARTALEAGLDARGLYEQALALAPGDGALLIGLAAARAAAGEGDRAADELSAVLEQSPAWTDGHQQLAQLLATRGRNGEATASIERALARFPDAAPLWETLLSVEIRRSAYESIRPILERAAAAGARLPRRAIYEGVAAAELDGGAKPDALFAAEAEALADLSVWRIRYLLRTGAIGELVARLDAELERNPSGDLWPYAAAAWRLAGDARTEWLEADARLVSVIDLTDSLPPLDELGAALRAVHVAKAEYLDQSVRGGTQTDGPLLSRIDPVIRKLRGAIVEAVAQYVAELPPIDPAHPLLRHRRDRRIRFSGSWSVRLLSRGRHSNHVHPQGWISSALYVSLPERSADEPDDAGWLTLGQPEERLRTGLAPWRMIQPKPARLVLFPSWMWHGTIPFSKGERLTVAFDVAIPR